LRVIPKEKMIEVMRHSRPPVAVTGRAGTAVLFRCNALHASGHNLLVEDRWHIYVSCNALAKARSRPSFIAHLSASRYGWAAPRIVAGFIVNATVPYSSERSVGTLQGSVPTHLPYYVSAGGGGGVAGCF
jgi:hypothetical protein